MALYARHHAHVCSVLSNVRTEIGKHCFIFLKKARMNTVSSWCSASASASASARCPRDAVSDWIVCLPVYFPMFLHKCHVCMCSVGLYGCMHACVCLYVSLLHTCVRA